MGQAYIPQIEWAPLEGQRPRHAGSNARLGAHGSTLHVSIARLTTDEGQAGFGACRATRAQAAALLGACFSRSPFVNNP
jgi:hypothetical protein